MDPSLTGRAVRASDADRARAVAALRRHYAVGRLETHELEERVSAACAARWRSELRALVRDMPLELPRIDTERIARELARARRALSAATPEPPGVDPRRVALAVDRAQRALLHAHMAVWALLTVVLVGVWLAGSERAAWPVVVLVLATALVVGHARGSRALSRRLEVGQGRRGSLRPPGPAV